jgi:MFS family permease
MWLTSDSFKAVFWVAVVPAFLAIGLLLVAVHEPVREGGRSVRFPLSLSELQKLSPGYWLVVAVATTFSLARFSEAFLILKAKTVGLPLVMVPMVLVVMNVVYALAAYPAGVISDRTNRMGVLIIGFAMLIAADVSLAFSGGLAGVTFGIVLWGLHMGFTQGLLATLVADTAPTDLRGTAYGPFNLLGGLALLAASVLAGALWDAFGARATFLAGAGFTAVAVVAWAPSVGNCLI